MKKCGGGILTKSLSMFFALKFVNTGEADFNARELIMCFCLCLAVFSVNVDDDPGHSPPPPPPYLKYYLDGKCDDAHVFSKKKRYNL